MDKHIGGFTTQFMIDKYKRIEEKPSEFNFKFYVVCRSRSCKRRRRKHAKRTSSRSANRRRQLVDGEIQSIGRSLQRKSRRNNKRKSNNKIQSEIIIRISSQSGIQDFELIIAKSSWQTVRLPFQWLVKFKNTRIKLRILCIFGCTSSDILVVGSKRAPSKLCPRTQKKTSKVLPKFSQDNTSTPKEKRSRSKKRCRKRKPSLYL